MGKTIFAIIGFIAAGGVFFFYTKPAYATIGELQAQIAQYEEALDKAAELQARKKELMDRRNAFNQNDIIRLQTMLPDHVDNIRLILELDSLASHYGMALENVDVATSPSNTSDQSAVTTISASAQKYDSLVLHFTTYGTYDTFRAFLKDLETSLRTVDLGSLTLSAQGTSGSAAGAAGAAYRYEMSVKTFWLE